MREIKFRAWDRGNEQMLYPLPIGTLSSGELVKRWDDENLMQFTNVYGIYEGDIVEIYDNGYTPLDGDNSGKYVVEWQFGAFWLVNDDRTILLFNECYDYEVLGNIHEHKHLLT